MEESRLQKILKNREQYDGKRTLVTEAEAAEFFCCSIDFVQNLRKSGRLSYIIYQSPHPRARPTVRYRLETLEKYEAKHERLAEADQ
jgi:hypothetical protein